MPCDGSIAVVVSAIDAAGDLPHPPVRVEAVGTQIIDRISWDQGVLDHEPQTAGPAAHLWTRTSLRPGDVDLADLRAALDRLPAVRVALGSPGAGVDGFRRSHHDALTTQRLLARLAEQAERAPVDVHVDQVEDQVDVGCVGATGESARHVDQAYVEAVGQGGLGAAGVGQPVQHRVVDGDPLAAHDEWCTTRDELFGSHPETPLDDTEGFAGLAVASLLLIGRFKVLARRTVRPF